MTVWLWGEVMDLYDYLFSVFQDIDSCIDWYNKWKENDQDIDGHPEWSGDNCFSMRAMAGHCSVVLEKMEGNKYAEYYMDYTKTKYGSKIYLN